MLAACFCHGFDGDCLLGLGHDYGLPGICQFMTTPIILMVLWQDGYITGNGADLVGVHYGRYLAK